MRDETRGFLIMVAATLVFSIMNVMVKFMLTTRGFHSMETVFFRSLFGWIFVATLLKSRNLPLMGPRPKLLAFRGFLGFMGLSCYYFAMRHLTLADTVILNKLSPVFVMIFAYFFLKERLTKLHLVVLAAALFGIFHVIQPQLDFAATAGFLGLASAVFSGMAYVVVKKLAVDHRSPQIVLAFLTMAAILSFPFLIGRFQMPSLLEWLIFIAIGFTSSIAQILMTRAYALGSPTPVSIASYGVVIFSAVLGFMFFGELQNPQALAGTIIVLGSLTALPFLKTRTIPPTRRIPAADM